jgi:hypothetical protein
MAEPVRLRLSRRRGFDLQALSLSTNGLPAVKVTRPRMWGNPFVVHPEREPGHEFAGLAGRYVAVPTAEDAVACFEEMMAMPGETAEALRAALPELAGKNLACWCAAGAPCHADVLLRLANRPQCDQVAP